MFRNAMSSANQGTRKFSLCLHIRKFSRALIHRANAREPVKPAASRAALRTNGLHYDSLRLHRLHYGFTKLHCVHRLALSTPTNSHQHFSLISTRIRVTTNSMQEGNG